jgi:hypothetical protein
MGGKIGLAVSPSSGVTPLIKSPHTTCWMATSLAAPFHAAAVAPSRDAGRGRSAAAVATKVAPSSPKNKNNRAAGAGFFQHRRATTRRAVVACAKKDDAPEEEEFDFVTRMVGGCTS